MTPERRQQRSDVDPGHIETVRLIPKALPFVLGLHEVRKELRRLLDGDRRGHGLGRGYTKLRRRLRNPDQKASAYSELERTGAETLLAFPFRDSLGNKSLHRGRG